MRESMGGWICATVVAGVALAFPAAATSAVASSPPFARGELGTMSCPSATLCYAGGSTNGVGVLDTIVAGKQTQSRLVKGTQTIASVSCPTRSYCALVGVNSGSGSVLIALSGSGLSRPQKLRWYAQQIWCQSAAKCVISGSRSPSSDTLEAVAFTHGQLGKSSLRRIGLAHSSANVTALSCASVSSCEMVGYSATKLALSFFYAGIGHGKIGKAHAVPGNLDLGSGLACASGATICYLTAQETGPPFDGLLMAVEIGASTLSPVADSGTFEPFVLSCDRLKACTAGGLDLATGAEPAIESYTNGVSGTPQGFGPLGGRHFSAIARVSPGRWIALASENGHKGTKILSGAAP